MCRDQLLTKNRAQHRRVNLAHQNDCRHDPPPNQVLARIFPIAAGNHDFRRASAEFLSA